ncbi:hypothetical protein [Streptomyces sp900129855]|uniref:Uncharacterized protein n=1 Tax=Streptomyces sp. 900129855 TaxID=3155129 RepID=A0ABV2ZXL2_9ACTN
MRHGARGSSPSGLLGSVLLAGRAQLSGEHLVNSSAQCFADHRRVTEFGGLERAVVQQDAYACGVFGVRVAQVGREITEHLEQPRALVVDDRAHRVSAAP